MGDILNFPKSKQLPEDLRKPMDWLSLLDDEESWWKKLKPGTTYPPQRPKTHKSPDWLNTIEGKQKMVVCECGNFDSFAVIAETSAIVCTKCSAHHEEWWND
jgi:hypothetical protein